MAFSASGSAPDESETMPAVIAGGRLRVVVADDHPCVAEFLERFLGHRGFEVVACVSDGDAALAAILEHEPDVGIVDLRMPGGGLAMIERLTQAGATTPILLYTGFGSRDVLLDAVGAGVRGFIDKGCSLQELIRAIQTVARGGSYLEPQFGPSPAHAPGTRGTSLTERERHVLSRTSTGQTTQQIASELSLSASTVRTYMYNATKKLGARNRTHAVVKALRYSVIT